jgi:hypothetical protein
MALFDLLTVTQTSGSGTGSTSQTFWFLGTKNLYTGDIATATGVSVAQTSDAEQPRTAVKELLLRGVLKTANAYVKVGTNTYKYKIRYAASQTSAEENLVGKNIPTGKAQGNAITKVGDPRRITSRD